MKKSLFAVILIVSVLLVFSCASTGSRNRVTDETFRAVYNRHYSGLILDGAESYTVRAGDTLFEIAQARYPDGYYYPVIMLASRDVVLDPDKIEPGMVLTIPNLQANLNNPVSRASVKGVIMDCSNIEQSRGRTTGARRMREIANSL